MATYMTHVAFENFASVTSNGLNHLMLITCDPPGYFCIVIFLQILRHSSCVPAGNAPVITSYFIHMIQLPYVYKTSTTSPV